MIEDLLKTLPLVPVKGKRPFIHGWEGRHWTYDECLRYIRSGQATGYAVKLGGPWLVVDVDGPKSSAFLERMGVLTPTLSWTSGKPGRGGFLYRVPDRFHNCLRGRRQVIFGEGDAYEVRYTGHISVLPPSIHPETGRPYTWINLGGVADVPEFFLNHLLEGFSDLVEELRNRSSKIYSLWLSGAVVGERNNSSFKIGAMLRDLEREVLASGRQVLVSAEDLFLDFCRRCPPGGGWGEDEWDRIWESVISRPANPSPQMKNSIGQRGDDNFSGDHLTVEDVKNILESSRQEGFDLRDFVDERIATILEQKARELSVPPHLMIFVLLTVISSLNVFKVKITDTWYEPFILWCGLVGESGSGKTPLARAFMAPLYQIQTQAKRQYREELKAWELAQKERGKGEKGPSKPEPTLYYTTDCTWEALIKYLSRKHNILLFQDELAGFVNSFNQYKNGHGADRQRFLSAYEGLPVECIRVDDYRETEAAYVSILGGIQPQVFERVLKRDNIEDGLWSRFIYLRLKPTIARSPLESGRVDFVERFLALYRAVERYPSKVFRIDFASKETFNSWFHEFEVWRFREPDEFKKTLYPKARSNGIRMAVGLYVLDCAVNNRPLGDTIPTEFLEKGFKLGEWLLKESFAVFDQTGVTDDPNHRFIARFCQKFSGQIVDSKRCRAAYPAQRKPTMQQCREFMSRLVKFGLASVVEGTPKDPSYKIKISSGFGQEDVGEVRRGGDDRPGGGSGGSGGPSDSPPPSDPPPPTDPQPSAGGTDDSLTPNEGSGQGGVEVVAESLSGGDILYVDSQEKLDECIRGLAGSRRPIGLDTETTGLDYRSDHLRLVTLSDGERTWVVDRFKTDPTRLMPVLSEPGRILIGHNLQFDLTFLVRYGLWDGQGEQLWDTGLAHQMLNGGRMPKLSDLVPGLKKDLQKSDWAGDLSEEQINYAAMDARCLLPLFHEQSEQMFVQDLEDLFRVEFGSLPFTVWMSLSGFGVDKEVLLAQVDQINAIYHEALEEFNNKFPGVNPLSPNQIKSLMESLGHKLDSTSRAALKAIGSPDVDLILKIRELNKKVSAYGKSLAEFVCPVTGRVYPRWSHTGAASGRFSCSSPNIQQIPRGDFRKAFKAPPGRVLVKADYSQIELRVAAEIAEEERMIKCFMDGVDLHKQTASLILKKPMEEVSKGDRQVAKSLNFGLLYGMRAKGLQEYALESYGVSLSFDEAVEMRRKFFEVYTGLYKWQKSYDYDQETTVRTVLGRPRTTRSLTEKLNHPVQGTAAEGLKAALAMVWSDREHYKDTKPVAVVHDEIVLECPADKAEEVAERLVGVMKAGMSSVLKTVPVEVECTICSDWSGSPPA